MRYKLAHRVGGEWVEHSYAPRYTEEAMAGGSKRLVVGMPNGNAVIERLADCLEPPFFVLYVLHTSRGEGPEGRYQSPPLDRGEFSAFLARFSNFLGGDARHDLWIHSTADKATLVWDRHNLLYAYGPLDRFTAILRGNGFEPGRATVSFEHMHLYRPEFDAEAEQLMSFLEWNYSPLRPGDEQRSAQDGGSATDRV